MELGGGEMSGDHESDYNQSRCNENMFGILDLSQSINQKGFWWQFVSILCSAKHQKLHRENWWLYFWAHCLYIFAFSAFYEPRHILNLFQKRPYSWCQHNMQSKKIKIPAGKMFRGMFRSSWSIYHEFILLFNRAEQTPTKQSQQKKKTRTSFSVLTKN